MFEISLRLDEVPTKLLMIFAKNSGTSAASKHLVFVLFSVTIWRSLLRYLTWFLCEDEESLMSLSISDLEIGGFGVGIVSMPCDALRLHQDWIRRRRVWFGVRSVSVMTCLVTGHEFFLPVKSHFSMLSLS